MPGRLVGLLRGGVATDVVRIQTVRQVKGRENFENGNPPTQIRNCEVSNRIGAGLLTHLHPDEGVHGGPGVEREARHAWCEVSPGKNEPGVARFALTPGAFHPFG